MAYIPSSTLETIIEESRLGLWFDKLHDGTIALVCKIPEIVIKALYRGAGCSFLLSVVRVESLNFLCLGLRVQDEPDNPFTVCAINASDDDSASLMEILGSGTTRLHCLNELNHPVLSAHCSLEPSTAKDALDSLRPINYYLLTTVTAYEPSDFARMVECAMDCFQKHIYRSTDHDEGESLIAMTAAIPLVLDIWKPVKIFEVSPTAQEGPFLIDDKGEGGKLEKQAYLSLDTIYPGSTYRSPRSGNRELIDILGFNTNFICLVESKSLSVLTVDEARSSQRRAATMTGHVSKAMSQLRGALRRLRSGDQIRDANDVPIMIRDQENLPAQAIVLLSEMYFYLDWKLIARDVVSASEDERQKALFHVMDLMELSYIVSQSGDADAFNRWMVQRWMAVEETGTAYGRSRARQSWE
jgi:hypothetical protein